MKFLFIFLMFLMKVNCTDPFYSKVLDDINSRHSYFLSIEIKDKLGQRTVIVENSNLFHFLSATKKMTQEDYVLLVKKVLKSNEALDLKSFTVGDSLGFYKLESNVELEKMLQKGKEYFMAHYFKNGILRSYIPNSELHFIIDKLFHWCILSKYDDETGYLVIEEIKE